MKKIGLLSDTHSFLDERIKDLFAECDEIWHAGDIGDISLTDTLATYKPLRAVYGNIDGDKLRVQFPEFQYFEIEGVNILMVHIAGAFGKYTPRLRSYIKQCGSINLLVCGHSHILKVQMDKSFNWLYMNPGAAGKHGFHPIQTCVRFKLDQGRIKDLEVIELGKRAKI